MKLTSNFLAPLFCGVVLAVAVTAAAGPEPLEKTVAPAPPSEIDWAGPYIGFNAGVAWTHYDVSRYSTDVDLEEQFYEAVQVHGVELTNIATFPIDSRNATERTRSVAVSSVTTSSLGTSWLA